MTENKDEKSDDSIDKDNEEDEKFQTEYSRYNNDLRIAEISVFYLVFIVLLRFAKTQ